MDNRTSRLDVTGTRSPLGTPLRTSRPMSTRGVATFRRRPASVEAVLLGSGAGMALATSLVTSGDRPARPVRTTFPRVSATHRAETVTAAADLLAELPAGTIVIHSADIALTSDLSLLGGAPVYSSHDVIEATLGRSISELMPAGIAPLTSPWFGTHGKRISDTLLAAAVFVVTLPVLIALCVAVMLSSRGAPLERVAAGAAGPRSGLLRFRFPAIGQHRPIRPLLAERLDAGAAGRLPAMIDVLVGRAVLVGPAPARLAARVPTIDSAICPLLVSGALGWDMAAGRGLSDRRLVRESFDQFYLRHASFGRDIRVVVAFAASLPGALVEAFRREEQVAPVVRPGVDPATEPRRARTLIIGAGNAGQLLATGLPNRRDIGLLPIGFVDDLARLTGRHIAELPILGVTADIPSLVERHDVEVIVIAMPSARAEDLARVVANARASSARVLSMPTIGSLLRAESTPMELRRVDLHEVLGRPPVQALDGTSEAFLAGKRVMITGAAGSIGQEITRQVARFNPSAVIALDINETGLFDLSQELALAGLEVPIQTVVASVTNTKRLASIFSTYQPQIVFHAAAYKHVPMMEKHPQEAVFVNAIGTRRVAEAAAAAGVERFVLISTDKAVRPSSVMGATKRAAELAVKTVVRETGMSGCCVRFGNVLGSRGSVIPTFEKQIDMGGPITVTDPHMRRFFMTIPEAASLTIQAGAFGESEAVYMLDMGEEVAILDLARRMIELRGLVLGVDIDIVYTGLRPGEKLREELALASEVSVPTPHPKISILEEPHRDAAELHSLSLQLDRLADLALTEEVATIRTDLFELIAAADQPESLAQPGRHDEDALATLATSSIGGIGADDVLIVSAEGAVSALRAGEPAADRANGANQDLWRTAG